MSSSKKKMITIAFSIEMESHKVSIAACNCRKQ